MEVLNIKLSRSDWNTIYTALRFERERNSQRPEVVYVIDSAIAAVQSALDRKEK